MIPLEELQKRWERCRSLLREQMPQAGGVLVFSRLNIYYFTGTFGNGLFWLPVAGEPVLLTRRGFDRALIESPLKTILSFHTYKDIAPLLDENAGGLPQKIGVEMNGLSWTLGNSLQKYLPGHEMLAADKVLSICRSRKTPWELKALRLAGERHEHCLVELLPRLIRQDMTEFEIAQEISALLFREGHNGILRMESYGEEVFLGHISIGESGNYPSVFNGPLGLRGLNPAVPHMGSGSVRWEQGSILTVDNGFCLDGYQTDKTQVYWLGDRASIPQAVQSAQECCIEIQAMISGLLKPGTKPSDLWAASLALATRRGFEDGFMGLNRNKVPFVGHGIGLAIDEYPALAKGFDAPLEEGVVLAIEPKIGLPGVGMVGVENTFEVTASGARSLTGEQYDIVCV